MAPRHREVKVRADELVVRKGLADNRSKAKALMLARAVRWGDRVIENPGDKLPLDAALSLSSRAAVKYVSRGGLKLEGALRQLHCQVNGAVVLDVGSSTGGFTDCLLQHGAMLVHAVDVGRRLIHEKLRRESRVRLYEEVNARYLMPGLFDPRPSLAVIDVSFISLTKVLKAVAFCLDRPARMMCLVKPQFELEKGRVPGGIVRLESDRFEALERVKNFVLKELGWRILGSCPSEIPGKEGNIEFFLYLAKD
ncbi:MAG: TlyA family RNA methyltransferase [Elusimicrobia bacterium]|nr:TlyA family RNA methyltransferase [Elusimicrobiota bacterium]